MNIQELIDNVISSMKSKGIYRTGNYSNSITITLYPNPEHESSAKGNFTIIDYNRNVIEPLQHLEKIIEIFNLLNPSYPADIRTTVTEILTEEQRMKDANEEILSREKFLKVAIGDINNGNIPKLNIPFPIITSMFIINNILPLIPTGSIISVVYEAHGKHYSPKTWELTTGTHVAAIPIVYESDYHKLTCAEGSIFNDSLETVTQANSEFKQWVKIGYYIMESRSHHIIHFSEKSYNESTNQEDLKHYNHCMIKDFIKI